MLDATSTADISFMLLIFFLVTSSMDTVKGLSRQLPPPDESTEQQDLLVKQRNVMALTLDADGRLTCNGDTLSMADLPERVARFVDNADDDPALPEKSLRDVHLLGECRVSDRHLITIDVSRETLYDDYFQMQNAVARGYYTLRDRLARQRFNRPYADCTPEQREVIAMVYPQRISELQSEEGGAQ